MEKTHPLARFRGALTRHARAFLNDRKANVALITGMVALPFMAMFALAVDSNSISAAEMRLQTSCDGAILTVASDVSNERITLEEADQAFTGALNANLLPLRRMVVWTSQTAANGPTLTGTISGRYTTVFGEFVHRERIDFQVDCLATVATSASELVLVLDTSRSMTGSRMDALRLSANDMIDELITDGDDTSRIAVVPFTHHVNVGASNRNQPWMNVGADYSVDDTRCSSNSDQYRAAGCTREDYACTRDGQPHTCRRWVCPPGATVEQSCNPRTRNFTFYGCVDSRPDPERFSHDNYDVHPVRGQLSTGGGSCANRPIQDLTSDIDTLKMTISQLRNSGDTYMAPGLVWGLRVLSPGAPFDSAEDFATFRANNGRKAIVLMSDGENTRSPGNSGWRQDRNRGNWQRDEDFANANTLAACDIVKAAGIELFTIAFDVQDADTEQLLEDCATSADEHYYLAANTVQLAEAFDDIGGAFRQVRLIQPEQQIEYVVQMNSGNANSAQ
ncbi:MAG: pilus assembly protein TadG-related protein [Pseudomonadota bacterium]